MNFFPNFKVNFFIILFVDVKTRGSNKIKIRNPNVIKGLLTTSFKIKAKLKK